MKKADIGIYGLGVMGANLALNFEENGFRVALFNRTVPGKEEKVVESFLKEEGEGKKFISTESEKQFIASLKSPKKILLMVKAGKAVDKVISQISQHLKAGDILIDGGNSHFKDTNRRVEELEKENIFYIGMGVSGGEEGARYGPSLMPGGSVKAWGQVSEIMKRIAAKGDNGKACCTWVGQEGAGHFVKMVHNGIEYGDMQLIAECYNLMKAGLNMDTAEAAQTFIEWNKTALCSFLLEITATILKTEADDGSPLIGNILDAAGQKGTGRWTSVTALDSGTPLPVITAAVYERMFSSMKSLRQDLANHLNGPEFSIELNKNEVLSNLKKALLASRMITLAEGFLLIHQISEAHGWDIHLPEMARIWQNGCIIRSKMLRTVESSFLKNPTAPHLLDTMPAAALMQENQQGLRETVSLCTRHGIPCPAFSSAITTYDSIRSEWLPANIIQAQRDYFGAHTYERTDYPRGRFFHTDWNEKSET